MLKKLLTYLKEGAIFNAVEVLDEHTYHFISVKKKKSELHILHTTTLESLESINEHLAKNSQVFLIINTGNILIKIVNDQKTEGLALVNKAFPNLKTDDFYFETFQSGENSIVTICRKDEVNRVLKKFEEQKIGISGFSLGVSQAHKVLPFVNEREIHLNTHSITILNSEINSIKVNKNNTGNIYHVNGMDVVGLFLLGFSAILGVILHQNTFSSNFQELNSRLKNEFLNKRFFNLFSKAALVFILGMLLINFLIFNYYFSESEKLMQTSEVNKINKEKLLTLGAEVKSKEKMAEDVLSTSSSQSSFYIDRIVHSIPATLLLNELNYQPLQKQLKEGEFIEFNKNEIWISGMASNSDDFSAWVETMEKFEWTVNVAIKSYDYASGSSSLFTLLIQTKDEKQN